MALLSSGLTLVAQRHAISPMGSLSLLLRLENATVSCATYVTQMFWPVNLAVFYPYPRMGLAVYEIILALGFLLAVSTTAFILRRKLPYIFTGWFWYLAMLLPVIGIVQVGTQAHADRYTYLPQVGLCVVMTWVTVELLLKRWPWFKVILGISALAIILSLMVTARVQAASWRNSETMWLRALAVTRDNVEIRNGLAAYYYNAGNLDKAAEEIAAALRFNPRDFWNHYLLGRVLNTLGNPEAAAGYFKTAMELAPNDDRIRIDLGNLLLQKGEVNEAAIQFQKAIEISPKNATAYNSLGAAFLRSGSNTAAVACFESALSLRPDFPLAALNLASQLAQSALRDVEHGVGSVERANQLTGGTNVNILQITAAVYAQNSRFDEAVAKV